MSREEYETSHAPRERQQYQLAWIHAQYQIAHLTGRPATLEDLAMISLQIADVASPQVAS